MSDDNRTGFARRWSERKAAQKQRVRSAADTTLTDELAHDEAGDDAAIQADAAATSFVSVSDASGQTDQSTEIEDTAEDQAAEPVLTDADMPDIATLNGQSDLKDFFNSGVSAELRRAALRHVFSLPVYNVRDGLNDYDDDYTRFEPLGDTVTSDMKWHKARKEREAEEERLRLAKEQEQLDEQAQLDDQKQLENQANDQEQPSEENPADQEHLQEQELDQEQDQELEQQRLAEGETNNSNVIPESLSSDTANQAAETTV